MPPKPEDDGAAGAGGDAPAAGAAAANADANVVVHNDDVLLTEVPTTLVNAEDENVLVTPANTVQPRNYKSVERDNFWGFIPELTGFATKIVSNEVGIAQKALLNGPSFTLNYMTDTFTFYKENPRTFYDEIISGFTVAIMQVPESIAFSFVAGVPPLSGLHATFWMATITGILGGKPGMISGAAGALAVVVADLTAENGVLSYLSVAERLNVLYMTMIWCGVAQILFAWLRLAKIVRLIPETGMIGFMNGLAIIIFMAQLPAFQKCNTAPRFVECSLDEREWLTFTADTGPLILSLFHVGLCMFIMKFFPLLPKLGQMIPASLVGLLVGTLLEHTLFRRVFQIATRTVQETAQMSGNLPKFDWPTIPRDSQTMSVVISYALTLAAIGGVESVLTLQACNEITDTVPKMADSNQELFAQGLANLASGLFRAMGGDAMIGQSTINIMNGARYRVSSTTSGLFMLAFVVAISGFIELLPVATLTGVLFMVVLSTFQWKTFEILRYGRLSDSGVIVLVTLIAVFFNLAVAIGAGIVFSALVHAWDSGNHVDADIIYKTMIVNKKKGSNEDASSADGENNSKHSRKSGTGGDGGDEKPAAAEETATPATNGDDGIDVDEETVQVKYVHVKGSIFFGSARHFINMFSVSDDPETVVIDLKDALIIDHSAVAAIGGITHRFAKVGKRVLLVNVPHKSHGRLHRTGDHDVLGNQIIKHPKELLDVTETGGVKGDIESGSPANTSTTNGEDMDISGRPMSAYSTGEGTNGLQNASGEDAAGVEVVPPHSYGGLEKLDMFSAPVEGVEQELDRLVHRSGSGRYQVRDAKTKKDA